MMMVVDDELSIRVGRRWAGRRVCRWRSRAISVSIIVIVRGLIEDLFACGLSTNIDIIDRGRYLVIS